MITRKLKWTDEPGTLVLAYALAIGGPLVVLAFRLHFDAYFEARPLLIVFLMPTILAAALGGLGPGLLSTALCGAITAYFLIPPVGSPVIGAEPDIVPWIALLVDGLLISLLTGALHRARRRSAIADQLAQQLKHIAATLPGAIYSFHRTPDGRATFPYTNERFFEVLGIDPMPGIVSADQTFHRIHPDDLPRILASTEESQRTLTRWTGTFRIRHPRRGEIWIEATGIPERQPDGGTLWSGFLADVTERVRAEQKSVENENKWRFALEGSGDGVWDWDAETNEVHFSRQWKAMLGYAEDEISNRLDEWESRVHPDDHARVLADIQRHFAGETPVYISEHRLRCKDGTYKWILDRGMLFSRTPDGRPKRVVGTHTDISAQKRVEHELSQQVDELRRWHEVTLGREERVLELKREVNELAGRLGQPPRYKETGTPT